MTFAERGTFKRAEIWFEMVSAGDVSHCPDVSLGLLTLSRWPPHKKTRTNKKFGCKSLLKKKITLFLQPQITVFCVYAVYTKKQMMHWSQKPGGSTVDVLK